MKDKDLLRAPPARLHAPKTSQRVRLLLSVVTEAVRSVQFISDPLLRRVAFEKNLDTLLDATLKTRRKPPKASSAALKE